MKTNHEVGAQVIIAVRENHDFARDAVEWLMSKQDDDERMQGTSLHRNGEGLSKTHAARVDMQFPAEMSHDQLTGIASAYTHTQLAEAIESGELKLPTRKKRRTLQIFDDEEYDEEQIQEDEEDGLREQEEYDENGGCSDVVVDRFGVHKGPISMPSKALCARVATIVEQFRADVSKSLPWTFSQVKHKIIDESSWLIGHVEINDCVIDAALYYALPELILSAGDPCRNIRLFWAEENIWANARVVKVSVVKGDLRVDLTFPEENDATGFVTGADIGLAYEII